MHVYQAKVEAATAGSSVEPSVQDTDVSLQSAVCINILLFGW